VAKQGPRESQKNFPDFASSRQTGGVFLHVSKAAYEFRDSQNAFDDRDRFVRTTHAKAAEAIGIAKQMSIAPTAVERLVPQNAIAQQSTIGLLMGMGSIGVLLRVADAATGAVRGGHQQDEARCEAA
jgi:hypothetical protein